MIPFRLARHLARCQAKRLATPLLLLFAAGRLAGYEPHKPLPPTDSAAVAPAAISLPAGWRESRPPAAAGAMAPALAADGEGFLATWIEPAAAAPGTQRVRVARWEEGRWAAPSTVHESATLFANWADVPGVVRAADGALYAWWLERSSAGTYTYDVRLARSTDQGVTFAALGVLHDDRSPAEHGFVSAVREGNGIRFYYLDGRATVHDAPMQLRSVFVEGERVGLSEVIDASVCDCCSTAAVVVAGPTGGSAVAYRDRTAAEIRDIQVATRPLAGTPTTRPVGNDQWKIAGCPVNGPALAGHGSDLVVAWYSAPGDRPRLALARSSDGGATWSAPQSLGTGKAMGQLALAALAAPAGGFAVSWLEGIEGGAEIRLAFADSGGAIGPPQVIARTGAGRSAGIPRLAAAAHRLALLWVDTGNPIAAGLRFATLPN